MNKSILIMHTNNIPNSVKNQFLDEQIVDFDYSYGEKIDSYISNEIIPQIKEKNIDIAFIKASLSDNYLELYGLIVAYHIRLSLELGDKRFIPIVILSDIDGYTFNKLSSIARILFTKNIYLVPNTQKSVKDFKEKELTPLTKETYRSDFLNLINIQPSENSTNHSIANEWAIYRWAKFLKVDSEAIIKNREKIASMLYFKYLLAKNPIKIEKKNGIQFVPRPPEMSGKVLYIDDEWAKGWSDILKQYFSKNQNIKFKTFEYDFKNNNEDEDETISTIEESCKEYAPDVVLLDLRLTQSDHEIQKIENLTGIKITKMIKKINPAIQIIMLTATGKSTILENLYEHGILGYIKKEHPQDVNMSTKQSFDKLKKLVDKGLDKKYLKEIWTITQKLQKLTIFQEEDFRDLQFEINSIFEILDSNMQKRYTYAMLSIFQALEIVNNYYIDDHTKKWRDGYTDVEIEGDGYTKQKIEAVLRRLDLYDEFIDNIDTISKMRKNTIHPPINRDYEKPTKENIVNWFKMLQTILEKIENDQSNS